MLVEFDADALDVAYAELDDRYLAGEAAPFRHARGLGLRRVPGRLALAPTAVLPSATWYDVGTPDAIISQLNTLPAGAPVNASMAALRLTTHDSGSGWVATPFLCDSFIHDSTPVYPDAPQRRPDATALRY